MDDGGQCALSRDRREASMKCKREAAYAPTGETAHDYDKSDKHARYFRLGHCAASESKGHSMRISRRAL